MPRQVEHVEVPARRHHRAGDQHLAQLGQAQQLEKVAGARRSARQLDPAQLAVEQHHQERRERAQAEAQVGGAVAQEVDRVAGNHRSHEARHRVAERERAEVFRAFLARAERAGEVLHGHVVEHERRADHRRRDV